MLSCRLVQLHAVLEHGTHCGCICQIPPPYSRVGALVPCTSCWLSCKETHTMSARKIRCVPWMTGLLGNLLGAAGA